MPKIAQIFLLMSALAFAAACGGDSGASSADGNETGDGSGGPAADGSSGSGAVGDEDSASAAAVETYGRIVSATYEDTVSAARDLDSAIDAFLEDPSEAGLESARQAWRDAREPYLQTEVFRFYDGPIDHAEDGVEGFINAWPLDEHYIDYVEGDESSGIINDPTEAIDADSLLGLNEAGGEKNIATGFHAIEFLLWGQDHDDEGPGDRPYTDFVDGGSAENQDRRRSYLATISDLLVMHLEQVAASWAEGESNYRADFEAMDPNSALERILTGMIVLSGFETGGERLQTALDTGDQEDEHSCFSDNTHRDMIQDIRGIQNVLLGSYTRIDGGVVEGTGILGVMEVLDAELAGRVADRVAASLELAESLQPPFDREIVIGNDDGRSRVEALVDSLRKQEEDLAEVFEMLGLSVEIPEA